MRNAVLHLITNKSGDFGSSLLPTNSTFRAYTTTSAEDALRSTLKINDDIYYLLNSLASVYAFPEIYAEFNETDKTFNLNDFLPKQIYINNASYYNTDVVFNVKLYPDKFPASLSYFDWNIVYVNDYDLTINCCDTSFTIPYTQSLADDGCTVITADWPAITGMRGGFKLNTGLTWGPLTSITMTVPAISFPYTSAVALAKNITGVSGLLAEAGVARNFANAESSIEKYALLMLALAKPTVRNPK